MSSRCLLDILYYHPAEKPMAHSSWYALYVIVANPDDIQGADAPRIIVAVLPVVHTVFPPSGIHSPPFSCSITMPQSPFRSHMRVCLSTSLVNTVWSQPHSKALSKKAAIG